MEKRETFNDSIWWERTGNNRRRIKGREIPYGDAMSQEPKYVTDSNLNCGDILK